MRMTLKQLQAFYWAATCANFAQAAERLHLSTSSLSKRVTELEESLGVTLFDRSGHKAVLTAAGERLLPRAGALLIAADETRISIGDETKVSGRCVLGVGELSALTWLPRLMAYVRRHYPDVRLEPHVDLGHALEQRLRGGELDCAVIAGRSSHGAVSSQTIGQMHFVWTAAPSLAAGATSFQDHWLEVEPVVTLPTGAGTTKILDEWLMGRNLDAPYRLTCNSWGAIAGLLTEGMGVGFLPEAWSQSLARRGDLLVLDATPPLPPLTYTFQKRRNDDRPILTAMYSAIRASVDFSAPVRLL